MFLGTPHRGSNMADWGLVCTRMAAVALIGSNTRILEDLLPDSVFLKIVGDEFSKMLKDNAFKIHSFQEAKAISGLLGFDSKVCLALHSTTIFVYKHSALQSIRLLKTYPQV